MKKRCDKCTGKGHYYIGSQEDLILGGKYDLVRCECGKIPQATWDIMDQKAKEEAQRLKEEIDNQILDAKLKRLITPSSSKPS